MQTAPDSPTASAGGPSTSTAAGHEANAAGRVAGSAGKASGGNQAPAVVGGAGAPAAGASAGAPSSVAGATAGAAAGGGGTSAAGSSSSASEVMPCNAADKGPEATAVKYPGTGDKPSGPFTVVVEIDPGLKDHTIYGPEPLGMIKHPIVSWGNGGCSKDSTGFAELLLEFSSQGMIVIADGTPGGGAGAAGGGSLTTDGTILIQGIDWAISENERPCSKYYHKLDLTKVGVSGQSCGGLMAIGAATDKRVTTSMPMNSGTFMRDQALYDALHSPMAIIDGGSDDIAFANGQADFQAINNIPILFANLPTGHGGTYWDDNAGDFGKIAVAWLRWQLLVDEGATGKGMFIGDSCGLCSSQWDLMWKMKPQ